MVVRNLLDNAIKYGGDEPQVEVEVRSLRNQRIAVRVADNGVGVPHDLRRKIFTLFFRGGDELKRTRKGTGVGLYIVHTLVQKLGGKVCVFDRGRNPGSVFEVVLPGRSLQPAPHPAMS
jgi:signal transduction histidine kinase